jgi:MoaA/NifB/PqqE/SkfB family radical SAM enzyme
MRTARRAIQGARFAAKAAWALLHRHHPLMVQIVPMRRCNLACTYCNEYDTTSSPVPLPVMRERVGHLARLGTALVTISGGEPLLHPELDEVIAAIRGQGMAATLISNGYHLSPERIHRLNRAGLDHLQISLDNVEPDAVSLKSLRLMEPKLRWLAEHAEFIVNINTVLGSGVQNPADALIIARRATELVFTYSVGIIHDGHGQLRRLDDDQMRIWRELRGESPWWNLSRVNQLWQQSLTQGQAHQWRCRAGARYLYVDEGGLVHYCSQQRGMPGIPLARYTAEDIRRAYDTAKPCAAYCTVNCVQQTAIFDNWRSPQRDPVDAPAPAVVASSVPEGRA